MMESFEITVNSPAGPCAVDVTKTTKVQEVIEEVAGAKHLEKPDTLELFLGGTLLTPVERPLVSFGIEAGSILTLVAAGSGV